MYEKLKRCDIINAHNAEDTRVLEYKFDENNQLMINENGDIYRQMKSGFWKEIENKPNHKKGYNVILINKKQYMRSRLVLSCLRNLDLNDKSLCVHYLNKNKLDCSIHNLEIRSVNNTNA